jgi:hypothetical protein
VTYSFPDILMSMRSFESTWPKAMCSVPIAQKALRIGPLSIDDEKASLDHATSLVGDENAYRDTLSHQRAAHTIGQDLHTLSLNEGKQPLIGVEMLGTWPRSHAELSHRMMDASPLVKRDVSPLTTSQCRARKAVSEGEETSTCKYSTTAKAALTQPIQSLALST